MVTLDELTDAPTEELSLQTIEYEEQFGSPLVHLFARTESGDRKHIEVVGHQPSFYVHEDVWGRQHQNHQWVTDWEFGHQSIGGDPLVKVYTKLPKHVSGDRDSKGLRDYFDDTWEADVWYCNRFLIDTGIKTTFEVDKTDVEDSQHVDGDYRVHVDALTPIETDWSVDPRMVTVDIEVRADGEFPEPEDAEQPVTAITAHDNYTDNYTVWVLRHDSWAYTDTEVRNLAIENRPDGTTINDVRVFSNETTLLDDFNEYVAAKRPDLLSGWNSSGETKGSPFDYPYLINRCDKVNVLSYRDWSPLGDVWDGSWGPSAKGVTFFDMMDGYMKTQWSEPKGGYSLQNISENELGGEQAKLEIEDIDAAWKSDVGTFLKYNIKDVQAVVGIEESAGVLDLFENIRKLTGAQFSDAHNNIDLLDVLFLRHAQQRGMALPTNEEPERGWYYGAHVFEPKLGRHENVVYPDLSSMYPNQIRNANASPETLVGTEDDLAESPYTEDDCRCLYIDTRATSVKKSDDPRYEKLYFVKPDIREGFVSDVVDDLMEMKNAYDGTEQYDAVKRIVNSCFTPDTEVLTPNGLRNITDIEVGDEVYGIDEKTGEMNVKPVINTVEKPDYDGELVTIQNGRMDFAVTPDHEMAVRNEKYGDEYEVVEAGELNESTRYRVPTSWEPVGHGSGINKYPVWEYADYVFVDADCHGHTFRAECPCEFERHKTNAYDGYEIAVSDYREHEDEIRELANTVLCRKEGRERRIPAYIDGDKFVQLAGWYVTEGNISNTTSYRVILSQQDVDGRKTIEKLLSETDLRYTKNDNAFSITSEVLSDCLSDVFGSGSHSKQLPRTFREQLSTFQRRLLAVTLIHGDGRWENGDKTNARYTTHSETLRDDVLSLFVECGHIARYKAYTSVSGSDGWRLYWRRNANHQFRMRRSGGEMTMDEYENETGERGVYCITVADNHTIVAGRNGKLSTARNCYGVLGDSDSYEKGYRLFDWRIAEGITLAGRKMIQDTADKFVDEVNNIKNEQDITGNNAYLVGGDTDSCMAALPFTNNVSNTEQLSVDIAQDAATRVNNWYDMWAGDAFNIDSDMEHYCELEIESYASRAFVPKGVTQEKAKKRYCELIAWDEGEWLDPQEFSATGIDIVRSDRAEATRDVLEDILQTILRVDDREQAREQVYDRIQSAVADIENGEYSPSYIARPKGMSKHPREYGTADQTPMPTYRGAKYANQHFDWEQMSDGAKPQLLYIDRVRGGYPSTYSAETKEDGRDVDAVALENPDKLPDVFDVDTSKQLEKVLRDPITPILEAINWSYDDALADSTQVGIDNFM